MPRRRSVPLTEAEQRLMEIVWASGPATVGQIVDAIPEHERTAYNTVQTMMKILERKGYVRHRSVGRAFVYESIVDREAAARTALSQVVQRFFGGSPRELDDAPASPFVFGFLGECNRLPCEVVGGVARFEGFAAPALSGVGRVGRGVALFRPSDTRLDAGPVGKGLPVCVVEVRGRGAVRAVQCQSVGGHRLTAELPEHIAVHFESGQRVRLTAGRVMVDLQQAALGEASALASPVAIRDSA